MGNSLKEALEKAGLKPSKRRNKRKKPKKSQQPQNERQPQHQSFCDCCKKTAPDVELYRHSNPSLQAKWLCIICADNHFIPDDTRQTNQSDFAMRGTFRRRYGKTKRFPGLS